MSARRKFRFMKEIAEGGFGKVYLAEQISADGFQRIVAVKLLHAKWSSHDEVVKRTRDEARLLGLIRHQHIVKVEDLTSIDGKCAIVMEYLEGVDLKIVNSFLREKGTEFPRAALFETMLGVASALDAAYNGTPNAGMPPLKVIHRDIKPSNIFLTVPGAVKLLDFGTARANFAEREAKTQALAFGSQGYMAPERMLGEEDTPAADIFSLGVTLYELLTFESFGRIPPRPNKFNAKVQDRVASVSLKGDPEWQEDVRKTLTEMLAYEPTQRPTAASLVDRFELLAQNAKDTSLRKFCRSTVAEAKQAEPELQTGDPLAGRTVDEDVSGAFATVAGIPAMEGGGLNEPGTSGPMSQPPPPQRAPGNMPPAGKRDVSGGRPKPTPAAGGAVAAGDEPAPSGGSGKFIILAVVVVLLLLVVGGVLVVVLGGGAAAFFLSGQSPPAPDVAAPIEAVEAKPAPEAAPAGIVGGKITGTDARTTVARSPTTLKASFPDGAEIKLTGGVGFKAEWDGKADFDLGELAEGKYRANVTPKGKDTLRGKSFEVVGKKKNCAFTFDAATGEWTGSCT